MDDLRIDSNINSFGSENGLTSQSQESFLSNMMDFENNPLDFQFRNLSRDSFESIFVNKTTIDKLIKYLIRKHDEGITFNQIQCFIEQQILRLVQTMDNLFDWL